jgi:hypothetical protein
MMNEKAALPSQNAPALGQIRLDLGWLEVDEAPKGPDYVD